ncbi:MAG TPA: energy transducer TonB [Pyrinomonadaceae bacterium]|nr:energy transducer TonB [Pyrinomonadaceae bacterium]
MKTKLLLITCSLFLFVTAVNAQRPGAAKPVTWQKYKVGGEVFTVALPLLPAMHIGHKWFEGDKEPRREVWLGSYADGVVYVVHVMENPSPQVSLQDFIAERLRSGTNNERDVKRDGLSGKSFTSAQTNDIMAQFFAGEDRLYEFSAFGVSLEDPRMTKFFSSVSFKKTTALEVFEGPGLPFEEAPPASSDYELANRIYAGKDVTTKARLAMKPEPSYTEDARQNAVAGTVVLKCVFSSNGSVTDITTISGLPYGLTQKAIEAAERIKFLPATKDGKHVSMRMQLEYNFNLY